MPWTHLHDDKPCEDAPQGLARELSYREAILEATTGCMASDRDVFVMGQGVDDPQGVFGTTKGLRERFGPKRVIDLPVAENGMMGIAIGSALAGLKPIVVHMRNDFLLISMDQIANHAAKWRYMFGEGSSLPIVIRAIIGRGWGSAAQHSQALHSVFAHFPGLKIAMPYSAYDAKGLLVSAVKDKNPVILFEHRWLYETSCHVPSEDYSVPIGKAAVRRRGSSITIVSLSYMVKEALIAADELVGKGVDAEVIDLKTVSPMDRATVIESVKKTGRLLVADIGWGAFGACSEVVAMAAEGVEPSAFKAPPRRVHLPHAPTPASPGLEEAYYPTKDTIKEAVLDMMGHGKERP
jgi:pyruvate dehydrogenase E1 component beta subunit